MRALWIGAALLACAGGASAAVGGHGATAQRGHVGASGTAIGRSDFRGVGFSRFSGAADGGWGFRHGAYSRSGRLRYERYGREPRYGIAGGDFYGYGLPYEYGGYSNQATDPYRANLPPGEFGPQSPYGYSPGGFAGLPSRGLGTVTGIYDHSGEGAYGYGYSGYAETPALPITVDAAGDGYRAYVTMPAERPSPTCGC